MPLNMSFYLTIPQIKNRTKTVTRRLGWGFLIPGVEVNAVEKTTGLKKGEKIVHLDKIRILSAEKSPMFKINHEECVKEGFPDLNSYELINLLRKQYNMLKKRSMRDSLNRIEFEYID